MLGQGDSVEHVWVGGGGGVVSRYWSLSTCVVTLKEVTL